MAKKPKIGGGPVTPNANAKPGSAANFEYLKPYLMQSGQYTPLGAPGPAAGGGGAPGTFTNTAEKDPRLEGQLDRLTKRMDDPEGSTGRAIDRAGSKIRDAYEGRRGAMKGMLAGRGVLGSSSIPELAEGAMMDAEGRDVNAAAADISLARERDNDAFMLGSTGAFTGAASLAQGDRRLGLDQYLGTRGLDMRAAEFAQSQQRNELQDLLSILGSF